MLFVNALVDYSPTHFHFSLRSEYYWTAAIKLATRVQFYLGYLRLFHFRRKKLFQILAKFQVGLK
jgi:hypothetical protein